MDLKFPHHECEIAQAKGADHAKPVNYWIHSNMLTLNGKRMSKSSGNTILPFELFSGSSTHIRQGFSPSVVRFFMLQAHYGGVLDFSNDALVASEKGFRKLITALETLNNHSFKETEIDENIEAKIVSLCDSCYENMNDDFNTPKVIATLFELVSLINGFSSNNNWKISKNIFEKLTHTFNGFVEEVLGLKNDHTGDNNLSKKLIEMILNIRSDAKANKNYQVSDQIRDELNKIGIEIKDGKDNTTYSIND